MSLPSQADLTHILEHTRDLWSDLRDQRLFITGGTGFFGYWLLSSLLHANREFGLKLSAVVLTRNPGSFAQKHPYLAQDPAITPHPGDICAFSAPQGEFSHVIHAATEASAKLNAEAPLIMLDTTIAGTRHTLEFARQCGAEKVLFTSSGAIYGQQPSSMTHVPESYLQGPDLMEAGSAYGEGKRVGEFLCRLYSHQNNLQIKIARCFAFVGPQLPLDTHFAIGNFIRDGLNGQPIRVNGDGTPYRSYLYAADLAIWLWTILLRGKSCYPYNVGSDAGFSIAALAQTISNCFSPTIPVEIAQSPLPGQLPRRYVPSIERARQELGLQPWIPLAESVTRTINWLNQRVL